MAANPQARQQRRCLKLRKVLRHWTGRRAGRRPASPSGSTACTRWNSSKPLKGLFHWKKIPEQYRKSYVYFHVQYVKKISLKRIYNHIAKEKKKRIFRSYGTLLKV
jgi:hypothetical protein